MLKPSASVDTDIRADRYGHLRRPIRTIAPNQFSDLLALSISLVSSFASVIAILMTKNNPESKVITIIPTYCKISFTVTIIFFIFFFLSLFSFSKRNVSVLKSSTILPRLDKRIQDEYIF